MQGQSREEESPLRFVADDVSVIHGRRTAVNHVNWDVTRGFHALLGPNGAGKTSLLRAMVSLQKIASGGLSLDGKSVRGERHRIGFLPQENIGRTRFTVREHLQYLHWLKRITGREAQTGVAHVIDLVDLGDRADSKIASLSGGMRRRVGIASALVGRPELVVMDEPSAGLDMAQRDALTSVIAHVAEEAIVIVSTHLVEDVLQHADTLTVMVEGSFVFSGPFRAFGGGRSLDTVRERYLELVSE